MADSSSEIVARIGKGVAAFDAGDWDACAGAKARLGKTQRLTALHVVDQLPRSAIGKVLKRELQDRVSEAPAR